MPTILEVICWTTGMGFAAVARVPEERWSRAASSTISALGEACDELRVETTICHGIGQRGMAVAIEHFIVDPLGAVADDLDHRLSSRVPGLSSTAEACWTMLRTVISVERHEHRRVAPEATKRGGHEHAARLKAQCEERHGAMMTRIGAAV